MSALIPTHPEPTADPSTLRFVIPPGTLTVRGQVWDLPAPLQELVENGVLGSVVVTDDAVLLTIAVDHSWRFDGPAIRTALHQALRAPQEWQTDAPTSLLDLAERLIGAEIGDTARGHGGTIELVDVIDDVVTVRLRGACHGCPASAVTVQDRLATALNARFPGVTVRQANPEPRLLRILRPGELGQAHPGPDAAPRSDPLA